MPKYKNGYQVIGNCTGYETQKIDLETIDLYQIIMPVSDNQLSEIVVSRPKEVNKNKTFPSMGIKYFEVYVSKNKEYPIEVFSTSKFGTIKVNYIVNSNGSLSHFLDEDKNYDECFKEALKLLKGSGKMKDQTSRSIIPNKLFV